jgi:hypothetical protein
MICTLPSHISRTLWERCIQWRSLSQLDPLLETLLNTLIASVAAILPAAVSGYFLLRSHHSSVKDELRIRAGAEQFQRKQAAYDQIWVTLQNATDPVQDLLHGVNWRRGLTTQARFLMTGSPQVAQLFTDIILLLLKEVASEQDLKTQDLEIKRLLKELWNVMRKELYDATPLPREAIKFLGPGRRTMQALEIWQRNRVVLERVGVKGLEEAEKMDVGRLSQETGIPFKDLAELKSMADRELYFWRESKVAQ